MAIIIFLEEQRGCNNSHQSKELDKLYGVILLILNIDLTMASLKLSSNYILKLGFPITEPQNENTSHSLPSRGNEVISEEIKLPEEPSQERRDSRQTRKEPSQTNWS